MQDINKRKTSRNARVARKRKRKRTALVNHNSISPTEKDSSVGISPRLGTESTCECWLAVNGDVQKV